MIFQYKLNKTYKKHIPDALSKGMCFFAAYMPPKNQPQLKLKKNPAKP